MISDDERREIARKLRGNPNETLIPHKTGKRYGMGCHEAADRFWNMCDRIKAAGDYDITYSTCSVLADLIELQSDEDNFKPDNTFRDFPDWFNEQMGGWDKW